MSVYLKRVEEPEGGLLIEHYEVMETRQNGEERRLGEIARTRTYPDIFATVVEGEPLVPAEGDSAPRFFDKESAQAYVVAQAMLQARAGRRSAGRRWVQCPICGEDGMAMTQDDEGTLIDCVNTGCPSNIEKATGGEIVSDEIVSDEIGTEPDDGITEEDRQENIAERARLDAEHRHRLDAAMASVRTAPGPLAAVATKFSLTVLPDTDRWADDWFRFVSILVVDHKNPTELVYNPLKLFELDDDEIVYALAHTFYRMGMFDHADLGRIGGRHVGLWNIAGNYAANGFMAEHGIGRMPADAVHDKRLNGYSVEDVYDILVDDYLKQHSKFTSKLQGRHIPGKGDDTYKAFRKELRAWRKTHEKLLSR